MEQFRVALDHHQAGRLDQAEAAYRQMLDRNPGSTAVLANLGALYLQRSRPGSEDFRRGMDCLRSSLEINPDQPSVHNNLANALLAAGEINLSDTYYLSAIGLDPHYLDAYINRTMLLKQVHGIRAAREWLAQYQSLFSSELNYWLYLGALMLDSGACAESLEVFDRAIALNAGNATAWYNRGNALRLLWRSDEALSSYRRCLRLKPDYVEAMVNMGVLLQDLKRFHEAVACYDTALKLRPTAVNACYNRALVLEIMGRFDEAVAAYDATLRLSPAYPYLVGRRHHARMQTCDWTNYTGELRLVCEAVEGGFPTSVPFPLLAMTDNSMLQRQCAELYVQGKFPTVNANGVCESVAGRRIRVGYLSPDFRTHAVGFLTAGLFKAHDRSAFEIFVISLGVAPEGDVYRQRIAGAVEHFVDASAKTDAEVVELVRSLCLDIAVDLAGHTMDARTCVFAQRVASVQVNYLGYPGTMGAPYIDVILADETVIPHETEALYTERVIRLPQAFQINDDQRPVGQLHSRSNYGLPEQGLVFASFNTSYKINPPVFDIWCRLMQTAPGSVLWLFGENAAQIANLRKEAAERGVDPERLVFSGRLPYEDHLARYAHVDLVLDTLPFNGGTSTSDALWGGAPVLTCMGQSFASRMSASLLRAVGLPELIATSLDGYEALGVTLARAPERLKQLKEFLQKNRIKLPLFNTVALTRDIEAAYRTMLVG